MLFVAPCTLVIATDIFRTATVANFAGSRNRNLEESFVLLAGASTMHRQGSPEPQLPPSGIPMQNLDDKFQQMAHVFEIASSETKVDFAPCMYPPPTTAFWWCIPSLAQQI